MKYSRQSSGVVSSESKSSEFAWGHGREDGSETPLVMTLTISDDGQRVSNMKVEESQVKRCTNLTLNRIIIQLQTTRDEISQVSMCTKFIPALARSSVHQPHVLPLIASTLSETANCTLVCVWLPVLQNIRRNFWQGFSWTPIKSLPRREQSQAFRLPGVLTRQSSLKVSII